MIILGITTAFKAQNVPNYIPTNGLVGWWPFNGNANDESGNGNDGTVNGATLTTDRFGIVSKAYNFDGVDDFIEVATSNGQFDSQNFSLSFWFKMTDVGSSKDKRENHRNNELTHRNSIFYRQKTVETRKPLKKQGVF
jgi:hypothetical protein